MSDETGESFPAIETLPKLSNLEIYYIHCYNRLENSRQIGMGLGPIPLSEILSYQHYLDEEDEFIDYIQKCDATYLTLYHNDPKNKPKK